MEEFAGRLFGLFTGGAVTYLIEIGRRTGLFDAAADQPMTCEQLADQAGLIERYVREWLAAMATSGIFEYDPTTATTGCHASTRSASPEAQRTLPPSVRS